MSSLENTSNDDFLHGPPAPPGWRRCRSCGCWDLNACWHEDYGACWWVEPDLCSHCHISLQDRADADNCALGGLW